VELLKTMQTMSLFLIKKAEAKQGPALGVAPVLSPITCF